MDNRKIKKSINKELAPDRSFTEFCVEQHIDLDAPKPTRKKAWVITSSAAAACAALALGISLPIALAQDDAPQGGGIRLSVVDAADVKSAGLVLYNAEHVESSDSFVGFFSADEALAYRVNDVVYGDASGGEYKFDYLIRLSEDFRYEEQDIEVQFAFTKNGVRYEYTLNWKIGGAAVTQVKFSQDGTDYFVFLHEYNGSTQFGFTDVQRFIELAFAPVTGGDTGKDNPWKDFFES